MQCPMDLPAQIRKARFGSQVEQARAGEVVKDDHVGAGEQGFAAAGQEAQGHLARPRPGRLFPDRQASSSRDLLAERINRLASGLRWPLTIIRIPSSYKQDHRDRQEDHAEGVLPRRDHGGRDRDDQDRHLALRPEILNREDVDALEEQHHQRRLERDSEDERKDRRETHPVAESQRGSDAQPDVELQQELEGDG